MSSLLRRRTGVEIELLAPPGSSRRDLAVEIARRHGGAVRPIWYHDSEPSLVPGLGRFLHLSQGFEVCRASGEPVCRLVDDITLVADLDAGARPSGEWYRVLTDDFRLLRLIARHTDPAAPLAAVLGPVAALWGVPIERHGDVVRLDDGAGATIALAAPQGGERERPCEIVTPPLVSGHACALEELLAPARDLGFTVPREAAVHLHYDAAPFRCAPTLANVVRLFALWGPALRDALGTNPHCRRLGPLPAELVAAAAGRPSYDELREAAQRGGVTKFADVNLVQLFADRPLRDTVEIRVLPGAIHADAIVTRAALVEQLLDRCEDPLPLPTPPSDATAALLRLSAGSAAGGRRL